MTFRMHIARLAEVLDFAGDNGTALSEAADALARSIIEGKRLAPRAV